VHSAVTLFYIGILLLRPCSSFVYPVALTTNLRVFMFGS
jgi:hypothetical protein